jgi:SAM-dependent methyltransferase
MPRRLDRGLESARLYQTAYAAYASRGVNRALNPDDREWSGDEPWQEQHYFEVGEDALGILVEALASARKPLPRTILDFPSGSGRVTRHLRSFFPEAELWACDIDENHLRFCATHLGARTRPSTPDLADLRFETQFDLIFCGSLLTHLPEHAAMSALSVVREALSPGGTGLVTVHGRYSSYIQRHHWKYVDDERFAVAERQAAESGYGFVTYDGEMRERFSGCADYGVALVKPSWLVAQLERDRGIRILSYRERDWADHQDVVVFGRPGIDEQPRAPQA